MMRVAQAPSSLAGSKPFSTEAEQKKLQKACSDLEAAFWQIMLQEMAKTVGKSTGSVENDFFTDMFYEEVAKELAKNPGAGLAQAMYKNLGK